jgi:hypothetical protein
MTDRKKPGVAFWATVMIAVVLFAYPLSIGPIWRLQSKGALPDWGQVVVQIAYEPFIWLMDHSTIANDIGASYIGMWQDADDVIPSEFP